MSVLLALDQSSKCSGVSIFIDNKLNSYGKFAFEDQSVAVRLVKIRNKIKELIIKCKPDYVIYEDIQLQNNVANNVQTFKVLAEVYGVVEELLQEMDIPHSSVSANTWKSSLNIKGISRQEQKKNAQQYVINKYGIKPTEDECDSICIGEYYLNQKKCAW